MDQSRANKKPEKSVKSSDVTSKRAPQTSAVPKENPTPKERPETRTREKPTGLEKDGNPKRPIGQSVRDNDLPEKSETRQPRQKKKPLSNLPPTDDNKPKRAQSVKDNEGPEKSEGTQPKQIDTKPSKPQQSRTDVKQNESVLMTNEDKPAESAQDTKKKPKKLRARSVAFVDSQVTAPKTPPTTKSGFKQLSATDFLVILGFWFIRFLIPWIDSWNNFNFHLLREPSYWDSVETELKTHDKLGFGVMSFLTVVVSLFVDTVNLRFFVFLFLQLLFVLCPIMGVVLNSILVARSYNQDFYLQYAFTSVVLFQWLFRLGVFSFPVQLSCVFGQIDDMTRQAHYNLTALLVLLESINRFVAFWVIPGKCPTKTYTQAVIWVVLALIMFTVFLLMVNFFFDWVKSELRHLKRPSKETKNTEQNVDVKTQRRKFVWFIIILLCLLNASFVFATLERLKPDEDWDKHYIVSATSMFILGEMLGSILMVGFLSIARWKLQHYLQLPYFRSDVLAMTLPQVMNFIALVTLFGRYATLSSSAEGEVIIGPIPEMNKMVAEFYNFDFRNRTVCVHSTSFRPLKILPRERGTREIYKSDSSRIYFTVSLDPKTSPGFAATDSFEFIDNTWATFIITLSFSTIIHSDIKAFYSKHEIVRVEGTQRLRPKKEPQIYFMNTFVQQVLPNSEGEPLGKFQVNQSEANFHQEIAYTYRWQTVVIEVPEGRVEIAYQLTGNSSRTISTTTLKVENYGVWSILLGHSRPVKDEDEDPISMMKAYKTMEVAGPQGGRLPNKAQLQKDWAVMAGMTFAGMASSGTFIALIYLFWLDTPTFKYRTTCIGVFWVLRELPVELSKIKVVDIGVITISVLACQQIPCFIFNFLAATQLYSAKYNFRNRPD